MDDIKRNLEAIRARIEKACAAAGRDPAGVTVLAVTKTVPPQRIEAAYELGIRLFGENRVQEIVSKVEAVKKPAVWHMIGQLQTNKVRHVMTAVSLIQSLDRMPLALELQRQAMRLGISMDVLVQVNIGREASKAGVDPDQTLAFIEQVAAGCGALRIKGLMAIAPDVGEEQARPYFAKMRALFEKAGELALPRVSMDVLSMGMTGDYAAAVAEGATLVRLGSAVFGARVPLQ